MEPVYIIAQQAWHAVRISPISIRAAKIQFQCGHGMSCVHSNPLRPRVAEQILCSLGILEGSSAWLGSQTAALLNRPNSAYARPRLQTGRVTVSKGYLSVVCLNHKQGRKDPHSATTEGCNDGVHSRQVAGQMHSAHKVSIGSACTPPGSVVDVIFNP